MILALSACEDMEGGITALPVAAETHGAILFGYELPTVPRLLLDTGLEGEGAAEAEVWRDSWTLGNERGRPLRAMVAPAVAKRLFPELGVVGVQGVLDRVERSLGAAKALGALVRTETIAVAISEARELHSQALHSFETGAPEQALTLALHAADALWKATPSEVARDLISAAERAVGRNQMADTYSEQELTRIRRLMYGASEALEERDYPRAIRRAYYACQLLGIDPP